MRKNLPILLALLLFFALISPAAAAGAAPVSNVICLVPGSREATVNGVPRVLDAAPVVIKNVTFVPLRFVSENLKAELTWTPEGKLVTFKTPRKTIVMQVNSPVAVVNGVEQPLLSPPRIHSNRTMVPLRFVSETLDGTVGFDPATKKISIVFVRASKRPVAEFTFAQPQFRPGELVSVTDLSYHPEDLSIVESKWIGLHDVYTVPGVYPVSLQVQDELGNWSDPCTKNLVINNPPEANFTTAKSSYRIGEPIVYKNFSSDPDGHELSYKWTNNAMAFFEPGRHTVTLTVTDTLGGTGTATVEVLVENEVYYTKEQFYLLYGQNSKVIPYDERVLDFKTVSPDEVRQGNRVLVRSNSPEAIDREGLLYRDTVSGPARVFVHHINQAASEMQVWLIARNTGSSPVEITVSRRGLGGPSSAILQTGRQYLTRYFADNQPSSTSINPGEAVPILSDLLPPMKPGSCVSAMADLDLSGPVELSFVALAPGKNLVEQSANLAPLPRDGHIRGTFGGADREIVVSERLGRERLRMVFGDPAQDAPAAGIDALTGETAVNHGNYGVVYTVTLERIYRDLALVMNARGGNFCGALVVNGSPVPVPAESFLPPANAAVIIERVSQGDETVLEFSPPSGSFLPVNLLLLPMPQSKGENFDPANYIQTAHS
ncbi:copper amine oxidase N-terminal domain-containing protein [Desulforudis sp. DRI-14]|uniref:copper amine oxidase N-terminal domain-containing protein n=1 Tax=Desulforudis sp. DRI-14 TaxID=3459793 RepID=UPI003BC1A1BD